MKITRITVTGYKAGNATISNNGKVYGLESHRTDRSGENHITVKSCTALSFKFEFDEPFSEEAPKITYMVYARAQHSKEEFELTSCQGRIEAKGNMLCVEKGFPENYAGSELAISFGLLNPYKPPFKNAKGKDAPTVKYIFLNSCEPKTPQIKSVVWSSKEKITFGEASPARTTICRNEDGFLHIHTRGMFGQKVKIALYEYDRTGSPALLKRYENLTIKDNVLYLPIEMDEIYSKAEKVRSTWMEGDNFDIYAEVIPLNTHIPAKKSGMIYLSIEKQGITERAIATIKGIMKCRIGKVDDKDKKGKNCGGKYCITKKNYKEKNAGKLIQEINIRLAGFGGNVPTDEFTDRTEKMIKQFQRDYMKVAETGKICGGLLKAVDEFCNNTKYSFNFSQTKCPCVNGVYKAPKDFTLCTGYGQKGKKEYPGMHRSLLFILKALLFYFENNKSGFSLNKIESGFRCRTNNKIKNRTSTNHMGNALDLHINKNNKRTKDVNDMETIRKDYFVGLMDAPYFSGKSVKFGWKNNYIGLEPKKFNNGDSGATTWIHYDIREFDSIYKTDKFYIKAESGLISKSMIEYAKELGFSELCDCSTK